VLSIDSTGFFRRSYQLKETRGVVISQSPRAIDVAVSCIGRHRRELEGHVLRHPEFQHSLIPVRVEQGPEVVRRMAEAAELAGVGPMAAVAGVLADLAVEEMIKEGARVAVVENGGEASVASDRPIYVALQAGDAPLSKRFGFRLESSPIGVATSSGLYSHALSFGEAEAVTVFAPNAGLADAAATAVGNMVKGGDEKVAVRLGVERGLAIDGVTGVLILYRGSVGLGGEVPPIIGVNPQEEITGLKIQGGGA
jgi:ApbE superfamily uncharacterized protein (UPF0280 family)